MKAYTDDKKLLDDLKAGEEAALEFLFINYYPRLRGYAMRFTRDEEIARDIIQECFMKIWEKRSLLTAISLSSLLFTMVRNGCLNHLKHMSIVEKHRLSYVSKTGGQEKLYHLDFNLDTDKKFLYEELQEQVGMVMTRLPDRTREVFTLSRFEGAKNREIAEQLNISIKAVEKHISRALRIFSEHFKDRYPSDIYIMVLACLLANLENF